MANKEGPAWSNVPTALVRDPNLSSTGKLAALALGCHTRPTFDATASRGVLAGTVSVSVPTIRRGLKELETHGWITVQRVKLSNRDNAVNVYRWNFNQAQLAVERMRKGRASKPLTPRVAGDPTPRVKNGGVPGVTGDPHTNSFIRKGNSTPERPPRLGRRGPSGPTPIADILPKWTPEQEAELDRVFGPERT